MNTPYRHHGPIDVSDCSLDGVTFHDSGGTNGWLADPLPAWTSRLIQAARLDGKVLRVDLRKLPAGQGIPPHIDPLVHASSLVTEHRYQIPIVTHPAVTMRWPDEQVEVHLEAGQVYEVDFRRLHEIVHRAPIDRVHLQVHTASLAGEN